MNIHTDTKIAALLKHDEAALELIIGLSPLFKKLRNPILRKMMAGRSSIGMAAKIGGCSPEDFFRVLVPLGFQQVEKMGAPFMEKFTDTTFPAFIKKIDPDKITSLDVRAIISAGNDPLDEILAATKILGVAQVLRIINSFEPVPLIRLLGKQGFISYTEKIQADLFHTYFFREQVYENKFVSSADNSADNWEKTMLRFESRLETIDVRSLPMPQPMHRILEMLDDLSQEKALLIYHKRIPVFLLPELEERKLRYLTCKIDEDNVNMLIFKS